MFGELALNWRMRLGILVPALLPLCNMRYKSILSVFT
jgi:hypothetical protein